MMKKKDILVLKELAVNHVLVRAEQRSHTSSEFLHRPFTRLSKSVQIVRVEALRNAVAFDSSSNPDYRDFESWLYDTVWEEQKDHEDDYGNPYWMSKGHFETYWNHEGRNECIQKPEYLERFISEELQPTDPVITNS